MKKNYAAIAELLRHFWSCFPVRTPQLEEKVEQVFLFFYFIALCIEILRLIQYTPGILPVTGTSEGLS